MSDEIREEIESFRERQMDRRKRERDERLGLVEEEVEVGRKKVKKEVEVKGEEDKKKPMKFPAEGMSLFLSLLIISTLSVLESPSPTIRRYFGRIKLISDLLVEYVEKDEKEGRILVRPAVGRNLPFGDGFEKLLLAWSFLNVMGYVLSFHSFFLFHSRTHRRKNLESKEGGKERIEDVAFDIGWRRKEWCWRKRE